MRLFSNLELERCSLYKYITLRVGVSSGASSYAYALNGRQMSVGPGLGEDRREFRLQTVPIPSDFEYRDRLRRARCHFWVFVNRWPRSIHVAVRRVTYASNGAGRTWKLYLGRGGRLGIRHAVADLLGRRRPRLHEVAGAIKDLMEAMGRTGQDRWLANTRQAR